MTLNLFIIYFQCKFFLLKLKEISILIKLNLRNRQSITLFFMNFNSMLQSNQLVR